MDDQRSDINEAVNLLDHGLLRLVDSISNNLNPDTGKGPEVYTGDQLDQMKIIRQAQIRTGKVQ